MSNNTSAAAIKWLIDNYEGVMYTNRPTDPGGPTKYGITLADFREFFKHDATAEDVQSMTRDQAEHVYLVKYWNGMHCDDLPSGVDFMVFDCAVNQGLGRASRFLQAALNVKADGYIGPLTLKAAQSDQPLELVNAVAALRMFAYGEINHMWHEYGHGWAKRLMDCHENCIRSTF